MQWNTIQNVLISPGVKMLVGFSDSKILDGLGFHEILLGSDIKEQVFLHERLLIHVSSQIIHEPYVVMVCSYPKIMRKAVILSCSHEKCVPPFLRGSVGHQIFSPAIFSSDYKDVEDGLALWLNIDAGTFQYIQGNTTFD